MITNLSDAGIGIFPKVTLKRYVNLLEISVSLVSMGLIQSSNSSARKEQSKLDYGLFTLLSTRYGRNASIPTPFLLLIDELYVIKGKLMDLFLL